MFFMTPQQREKITSQKLDLLNFHNIFMVLGMGVLLQILLSKFLCYVLDFTEKQTTHYTDIQQKLV